MTSSLVIPPDIKARVPGNFKWLLEPWNQLDRVAEVIGNPEFLCNSGVIAVLNLRLAHGEGLGDPALRRVAYALWNHGAHYGETHQAWAILATRRGNRSVATCLAMLSEIPALEFTDVGLMSARCHLDYVAAMTLDGAGTADIGLLPQLASQDISARTRRMVHAWLLDNGCVESFLSKLNDDQLAWLWVDAPRLIQCVHRELDRRSTSAWDSTVCRMHVGPPTDVARADRLDDLADIGARLGLERIQTKTGDKVVESWWTAIQTVANHQDWLDHVINRLADHADREIESMDIVGLIRLLEGLQEHRPV